jgi:hypothetical protein
MDWLEKIIKDRYKFDEYAAIAEQFVREQGIKGDLTFPNGKKERIGYSTANAIEHALVSALIAYDVGESEASMLGFGRELKSYFSKDRVPTDQKSKD